MTGKSLNAGIRNGSILNIAGYCLGSIASGGSDERQVKKQMLQA